MTLQGEETRHRLTACNQEQRPSTPRTGTTNAETAIQTRPLGSQAAGERRVLGTRQRVTRSIPNALLHDNTNLKGCAAETALQVEELNAVVTFPTSR